MSKKREAHFCPMCGTPLEQRERYGLMRPVCPACDHIVFFSPNVAVVVFIRQGEQVLFVKRAGDPKKGFWVLPAGFMEWNEDPEAAARREVLEETGLEVRIDGLLDVFHTPDDGGQADIVIAYAATIIGGLLQAADDAEAAAWFTKDTVPEIAFLPTERIVSRWQAGDYQ
jgi:ADP-ribose pyrophosphatase YjhB (NUDIX family)